MAAGSHRGVVLRRGESPVEVRRCRATVTARMLAWRAITSLAGRPVGEGALRVLKGHVVRGV